MVYTDFKQGLGSGLRHKHLSDSGWLARFLTGTCRQDNTHYFKFGYINGKYTPALNVETQYPPLLYISKQYRSVLYEPIDRTNRLKWSRLYTR